MPLVTPVGLVVAALRPEPDEARTWVERELSRPEYQVSLLDRFTSWLNDLWQLLQANALGASSLSTGAAVVLFALLLAAVLLVAGRLRREPGGVATPDAGLGTGRTSPEEHRAAAEAALAAGDHDRVIVEAFRAVAARAVDRGVLDERVGRTAGELATELAPAYDDHAADLRAASNAFDRVFYGHVAATETDARAVLELEDALRNARPRLAVPDVVAGTADR